MKVISAKNPSFARQDHSLIDLIVHFDELGEVPFTACAFDVMPYGIELYNRALSGEFGQISSYKEPSQEDIAYQIREKRNALLIESDWTQLPDVPESIKLKWSIYRQSLRDVPQQDAFPDNITWPEKP